MKEIELETAREKKEAKERIDAASGIFPPPDC
jgi:hypothetical protein